MKDFVISVVLLLITISPFIFYRLGKKRTTYANVFVVALYFICWLYILFAGVPHGLSIITVVWLMSLFLTLLFLVVSGVQVFYKIYPSFNKYVLCIIFLSVLGISLFIFIKFYSDKTLDSILDLLMIYTVPLFLAILLVIGITHSNKNSGVTK